MDQQVGSLSRRKLLTGVGAATSAIAVAAHSSLAGAAGAAAGVVGAAGAVPVLRAIDAIAAQADPFPQGRAYGTTEALSSIWIYITIDASAFAATSPSTQRVLTPSGVTVANPPGTLVAPVPLPTGAWTKDLRIYYVSPAGTPPNSAAWRYRFLSVQQDAIAASFDPIPQGTGIRFAGYYVRNDKVEGNLTYSLSFEITDVSQYVAGAVVGYLADLAAYVPATPTERVLETRTDPLGKLKPNEERYVSVGVPPQGFSSSAVINLTVTNTEGAGYVAHSSATTRGQGIPVSTGPNRTRTSPTPSSWQPTSSAGSRSEAVSIPRTSSSTSRAGCGKAI